MKKALSDSAMNSDAVRVSDATLRNFVGYRMKRAFNVVQADLIKALKPFDLRMLTYTALVLIADNPGVLQSQLAAAMDIERPNLVVIIDELERRALIVRDQVPSDRRAYALRTTLAGQQLFEKAVAAVTAHEAKLLQDIEDQSVGAMTAALARIEANRAKG